MKLKSQNPPHIRSKDTNLSIMFDVTFVLCIVYSIATYFYGTRVISLGVFSVLTTCCIDAVCTILTRKIPNIRDLSPVVTGMIIPLLMPATISREVIFVACLFAIAIAKAPFGGVGNNIFNPAVAGVAFAMVSWPKEMFLFPVPLEWVPVDAVETARLVTSPAYSLSLGGVPGVTLTDMLLGNVSGAMGTTHILVLLTCFLYLAVRKVVNVYGTVSFLLGAAVVAAIMPRAMMPYYTSIFYELMSGMLLFAGIFLINDPVTSPKRLLPKVIYCFISGALAIILRHLGRYEESLLFAILIMNSTVWILDLWAEHIAYNFRRKKVEDKNNSAVSSGVDEDFGTSSI